MKARRLTDTTTPGLRRYLAQLRDDQRRRRAHAERLQKLIASRDTEIDTIAAQLEARTLRLITKTSAGPGGEKGQP
jgi:hypothetical protein